MSNAANKSDLVAQYRVNLDAAFAERTQYEVEKQSKDNIFSTLKDLRDDYKSDLVVEALAAAKVDANFINRQDKRDARFNVYSAEKVFKIARASLKAATLDQYTLHIFKTAHAMLADDVLMTQNDAYAAICAKCATDDAKTKYLSRMLKIVAVSTATTQASSSINALKTFDVLIETRDAMNNVAYKLNTTNATTKKLCKALELAL
jgi:hypothetical protein